MINADPPQPRDPRAGAADLSAAAEEVFFAHPDFTESQWHDFFARQAAGDAPLSRQVIDELKHLVHHLFAVPSDGPPPLPGLAPIEAEEHLCVKGLQGRSYDLLDRLGTGGHSIVYRGLQKAPFERVVAVKVCFFAVDETCSLEDIRELEALRRLHHPGLCELLDAGVTPWLQPFLVFEFVDGQPLDKHIAETTPSLATRLQLFEEILEVVRYAHSQGVIHRDLKPQNILVHASSNRIKLIDFGISRVNEQAATTHGTPRTGTREYQSPEQAGVIDHPVDVRSDVYSLGCVLFEVLTGERLTIPSQRSLVGAEVSQDLPSRSDRAADVDRRLLAALKTIEPRLPSAERVAFSAILHRCLATQPCDRFQSTEELQTHFKAAAAGNPLRLPASHRHHTARRVRLVMFVGSIALGASAAIVLRRDALREKSSPAEPGRVAATQPADDNSAASVLASQLLSTTFGDSSATSRNPRAPQDPELRSNELAQLAAKLDAIPAEDRDAVGLQVAEQAYRQGLFFVSEHVVHKLLAERDNASADLTRDGALLDIALRQNVFNVNPTRARDAGALFVDQLSRQSLLFTTAEGIKLLGPYLHLLYYANDPESLRIRSDLLEEVDQHGEAMIAIDQPTAVQTLIEAMFGQLVEGHPERALVIADKIEDPCAQHPNADLFSVFTSLKADALLQRARPDEALTTLTQALASTRPFSPLRRQRLILQAAMIQESRSKPAEAVALLVPALPSEIPNRPSDADMSFRMHQKAGELLVQLTRYEEAVPLLSKSVELISSWEKALPSDAPVQAYRWLGEAQAGLGDTQGAEASFTTALANLERLCAAGKLPREQLSLEGGALQARIDVISTYEPPSSPVGDDIQNINGNR